MRSISAANQTALAARSVVARDFLWLTGRHRDTGVLTSQGFWSGEKAVTAQVVNPDTGSAVVRTWTAAGGLISISALPLVANLTVQNATVTMSQIDEATANIIRGYSVRFQPVQIFRGLFHLDRLQLVAAALPRFVGVVNKIDITTPAEGGEGAIVLQCASHTIELGRANTATRSDADQKRRDPTDNFYQDTATVGDWPLSWGQENARLSGGGGSSRFTEIIRRARNQ